MTRSFFENNLIAPLSIILAPVVLIGGGMAFGFLLISISRIGQ